MIVSGKRKTSVAKATITSGSGKVCSPRPGKGIPYWCR